MQIQTAILNSMRSAAPYADTKPLSIERIELDPPGPGEILVKIVAAGSVPFRSVGHQRRSAAADADGAGPRGGRHRRGTRAGVDDLKIGDQSCWSSCRVAGIASPASKAGPRYANRCRREPGRHAALGPSPHPPPEGNDSPSSGRFGVRRPCGDFAALGGEDRPDLPLEEAALFGCAH